jgi:hypothetical protein
MLTAEIPIPDFAIPYAAPRAENTIAMQQPIAPKKDYVFIRLRVGEEFGRSLTDGINWTRLIKFSII